MKTGALLILLISLAGAAMICLAQKVSLGARPVEQTTDVSSVMIPFALVNRHIVLKVSVNNSAPLSFVLDTGGKFAIINLERARTLGLNLQGNAHMQGAGSGSSLFLC
jgi:predicted aspartyl protease